MKRIALYIISALSFVTSQAQVTIGGDVYGGGKEGSVCTGNTDATKTTRETAVTLNNASVDATSVTIAEGAKVRTVFGGGRNGRCYGQTHVSVDGGQIGDSIWNNTIHGGLFGAGDGQSAFVFGKENKVLIKGGVLWNNVYGGGNQADLMGSTQVALQGGYYHGNVFGGSRMADIFGYAYVNLDGANVAEDSILIVPKVYGGNDISGNIQTSDNWTWTQNMQTPFTPVMEQGQLHIIDGTWNAFVHASIKYDPVNKVLGPNNIFVGEIYGGGNGDYNYTADNSLTLIDSLATDSTEATTLTFDNLVKPEVEKVYLDILNGTYGNLYGGGNNATVTKSVDICLYHQKDKSSVASIPASRIAALGLSESIFTRSSEGESEIATPSYQFDRVFGGNNKATMSIRPNWYLVRGTINSLYSGGNMGDMTAPNGLILPIASDGIYVNNCFGGCRMADVHPTNTTIKEEEITSFKVSYSAQGNSIVTKSYNFEEGYAARVMVMGGHIDNVYGGNDISGKVYFGTNVAINGAVSGNIYGGGNGSYAYTDQDTSSDYYYDPTTAATSVDALNAHRPHVENTLVHIWGEDEQQPVIPDDASAIKAVGEDHGASPVIVTGGVYCGGNSASIEGTNPKATFKIGKNVIINAVYLGSNGEDMVQKEMLAKYADRNYSSVNLTDTETFAKYMEGCAVNIRPTVLYDWTDAESPNTYIGSLYGGGNVGSVTYDGPITIDMPVGLRIFDRVVGGCNKADVDIVKDDEGKALNAAFKGGVITANADASKSKVTLNMNSYLEPRELSAIKNGIFLESASLRWDTRKYYQLDAEGNAFSPFKDDAGNSVSVPFILYGANVFGGCYSSGHIAGDVTINVSRDLVSPAIMGNAIYSTPQNFLNMGSYVFAKTMTIYGGGYGKNTSIWGNTHVNLSDKARVIAVMGGADFGTIGTDQKIGNTFVTCDKNLYDYSQSADYEGRGRNLPYNAIQIYGGAFAGTIYGHTELKLNGGTFRTAYGGSCDADIQGYSSLYVGAHDGSSAGTGFPYIHGYAYGGNDFGGQILGYNDFTDDQSGYNHQIVRAARYVEYNAGRIGYQRDANNQYISEEGASNTSLYGGSCGSYDYQAPFIQWNYLADGKSMADTKAEAGSSNFTLDYSPADATFHYPLANEEISTEGLTDGFATNIFVNVRCQSTNKEKDVIQRGILAGGRGIMTQTGIVDAKQTYLYLHGASWSNRTANLSYDIYGGGYYSIVENTKIDLESGCAGFVYGGSYGTSAKNLQDRNLLDISYNSTRTEVNLYDGMDNSNMAVFGGGGYTGARNTFVNLYGGRAKNVYGGSYNEGFCTYTHVNVPASSTASVNAIFGGGYGNDVSLPCDEQITNIDWSSSTAYVADMIYGGNNAKRAAMQTNVNINAPVKTSVNGGYTSVCGAGNGECTVAGFVTVNLNDGARVANVYGGGRDGKVFGYYKNISGAKDYYEKEDGTPQNDYISWFTQSSYKNEGSWEGSSLYYESVPEQGENLFGYYRRNGNAGNYTFVACKSDETADGTTKYYQKYANVNLTLEKGSTAMNVYGAGLGENATLTGSTRVHLHGGTVVENVFGGGENGSILYQKAIEKANDNGTETTLVEYKAQEREGETISVEQFPASQKGNIYAYVCFWGGEANTIYGGGYNGRVGTDHSELTGETRVEIGEQDVTDNHYAGVPNVRRGIYGGGYKGAVYGTAKIQMHRGYIGYNYDASTGKYTPNLAANEEDTHQLLKESGNIFGGGYGEGATTDQTIVNMYDGTVRNSLYGGGEIASVGVADISTINAEDRTVIPDIEVAGSTQVNMYGGLVRNNVFGGGRGYAIDAYGNTQTGEVGYADGYTFGKTHVNIYRGTIGTDETLAEGAGNVFGGGNIGYVYAADDRLTTAKKNVYKASDGYYHTSYGEQLLTEDSKVLVTPWARVTGTDLTIDGKTYTLHDYVPREELDKVQDWSGITASLGNLDEQGVIIRNAVFAGGNVSAGSDKVYANAVTIYGNSTASVIDCLNKDLLTIGADDVGGLYGDGNLTFVDGYRELNITNYGTDYYNLNSELTIDEYQKLNERERAYFELKYVCIKSYTSAGNTTYTEKESKITGSEYNSLSEEDKKNWKLAGFCTLYAGRMMNTIQRADFCGVFGSRMVLKGAQDRVPSVVDYTKYTINRVGELSLNQVDNGRGDKNGNYFGIYNVVNYLGAMTSDVKFSDVRTSTSSSYGADGTTTYYGWKSANLTKRSRNNGTSKNKVALASGIWLELVQKLAESASDKDVYNNYNYQKGDKIYGPITGIVELDIINAATGEGGGYVYALNEHGIKSAQDLASQTTLATANSGAVSYKQYQYTDMTSATDMETSGNFINAEKRIIDDCYPNNGAWLPGATPTSTAHYWFIRGEYYVYDQYISAYTGAAQSYAESVKVPLTISAEAHGKLKLLNVQNNFNAYWTDAQYNTLDAKYKLEGDNSCIIINGNAYHKNSPISYWDYSHLTDRERELFQDGTYVCTTAVGTYQEGQVLTSAEYNALSDDVKVNFDVTNAVDAEHGFLLTYVWDNPRIWSDYYIKPDSQDPSDMISSDLKSNNAAYNSYLLSPTFKCTVDNARIYGQKYYIEGELIDQITFNNQLGKEEVKQYTSDYQASFESAYVTKSACKVELDGTDSYYVKGATISATTYGKLSVQDKSQFERAYICTQTQKVTDDKYYINGDVIAQSDYDNLSFAGANKSDIFSLAYQCTDAGAWGGMLFSPTQNYDALRYCNLKTSERKNFQYNLDAFDVLMASSTAYNLGNVEYYVTSDNYQALPNYGARHQGIYAAPISIDYTATYTGTEPLTTINPVTVSATSTNVLNPGAAISREDYEDRLVNESANYAVITVMKSDDSYYDDTNKKYYIVKSDFYIGDSRYSVGTQVKPSVYRTLSPDNQNKVDIIDASLLRSNIAADVDPSRKFYYCTKDYTPTTVVTTLSGAQATAGSIIDHVAFSTLKNEQLNFVINGSVPTETSTLYVAREPNINQLSQDKIVTVIYEYSYVESDESQSAYETVKERHVINIHVHFESGLPTVGELLEPTAVLPGNVVGLNQPSVSKGAYEILGGGWEIYANDKDAQTHKNGEEYTNNNTKMYWYQNGYQIAYYAKSYLGKTFSNPVKISVANYHRMADVMANGGDSDGDGLVDYMYLNEAGKNTSLRDPKVYVKNDSELDQMSQFFTLTTSGAEDFSAIQNCYGIDFIVDGDIEHTATWTSVGNADACFSGNFHGDGHTISGLNQSLFGSLCGNVYNVGVTGSFTGSGITDAGDGNVTNCWVVTTGNVMDATKAIHGGSGNVVNCYYYNDYATRDGATSMPLASFVDGDVAHNLNGHYLTGRTDAYVLSRYDNEDFIYADGVIPQTANIRKDKFGAYAPKFPDDYIFFGQNLTYGIATGTDVDSHVEHPEAINRQVNLKDESLNTKLLATDVALDNRVYRAPGYYKSKMMSAVYFNKPSAFKGIYSLSDGNIFGTTGDVDVYRNLTAINFSGSSAVLDYAGISQFTTSGLTRNLLVYADPVNDAASYATLNTALPEATLTIDNNGYNEVVSATDASTVKGHLIDYTGTSYAASRNHYLVDKEFFNCPIRYTFADGCYMWYQRKPDNYVDASKGWEAISLPFTADLVSTQTKGEITHFYEGSTTGHEYWLREFNGQGNEPATPAANTYYAAFNYPAKASGSKVDDNTFLWDYYYSHDAEGVDQDKNQDAYQTYYQNARTYENYPLFTAATPYIAGFPGARYYEFDMSGTFVPANRLHDISAIEAQTISFVSVDNATIQISDDELTAVSRGGYDYLPNYMDNDITAGSFVLNGEGSSFDQTSTVQTAVPFRSYFTLASSGAPAVRSIAIASVSLDKGIDSDLGNGVLNVYAHRNVIVVTSTLHDPQFVTITNATGIVVAHFYIQPGETIETTVPTGSIYIVNDNKIAIK